MKKELKEISAFEIIMINIRILEITLIILMPILVVILTYLLS